MDHAGELFSMLPGDVTLLILRRLRPMDLVRMSEASWSLRRLACQERLWRPLVEEGVEVFVTRREMQSLEAKEGKRKKLSAVERKSEGGYWMGVYGRHSGGNGCVWIPPQLKAEIASVPKDKLFAGDPTEYKMIVLGDGGSGKSATIIQFVANHFVEEYDPTIEDSYRKRVCIRENPVLLDILDTAGPEEYPALREQWIRSTEGFIILYSITSRLSFEQLRKYCQQVCDVIGCDTIPGVIVGNKVDRISSPGCAELMKREVGVAEGKKFAAEYGMPFIESSARTRVNVEQIFTLTTELVALQRFKAGGGSVDAQKDGKKCVLQ